MVKRYLILITMLAFFIASSAVEAKLLPQAKKSGKAGIRYSGPSVSVKLRKDRQALNVYFSGVQNASSISYTLSYQTNGKDEGAGGSIDPSGTYSLSRELLFGTCSSGVCRYHTGITNAKFEVVMNLNSGKKITKRFRIRV